MIACERCGTEMNGRRKHARFCSDACRALAYRDRHPSMTGTSGTELTLFRQMTHDLVLAAHDLVAAMQLLTSLKQ